MSATPLPAWASAASGNPLDLGIEWDAENRLLAVKQGGNTLASFTYDASGRRATKTAGGVTITYVYDGAEFLEARPSSGATTRYVYGDIDRPLAESVGGVTSYVIADHLGSVVRVTDPSGAPTLTREYDPWGNLLQGSATSGHAFTGREWDPETGLYYYRARYYDPLRGHFLSQDPADSEKGLSLYRYARGNPLGFSDPLGLSSQPAGPQFLSPSQVKQYLGVLSDGYNEALRRLKKPKCKAFFSDQGEETLEATKYYFGELPQGPQVAAQTASSTLVQVNTKGLYMSASSGKITLASFCLKAP
jgi:RHS repeat-associated protein